MLDFATHGIDVAGLRGVEAKALCPQCSHTRKKARQKCLNVNLETGLWNCWHCGWSGKAFAPDNAKRLPRVTREKPQKVYVKPEVSQKELTPSAAGWLMSRGITPEVSKRNRLAAERIYMPQVSSETLCIAFPYFRDGEVINVKYRDNAKNFRLATGAERLLYGLDDIADTTIIVEGEMDKLAVEVAGYQACVSVPDGAPAPNTKNIESKFDFLDDERLTTVKQWVIAVDNDAPGLRLQEELVRRFGSDKCLIVTWPEGCKDANDVLMKHGAKSLQLCIDGAQPLPIVGAFEASAFTEDFLRMYAEGVPNGNTTGWEELDAHWRVQLGQTLIVTGIPGHGKSEWVDALMVNLARVHGWRAAFYSPENWPVKLHMMKLAEKIIGKPYNPGPHERMTASEASDAADWMQCNFRWIMPESPSLDEIIDKAKALVRRDGIRCLVLDPWNEVEHNRPAGMTESEYVSVSLMRLRRFARDAQILLVIIAHPKLLDKKLDGSYPVPTPYDISGGAMWRNKADNCIAVYANPLDPSGAVEIHVQKVKFKLFGKPGMVPMRWDRLTGRYYARDERGNVYDH